MTIFQVLQLDMNMMKKTLFISIMNLFALLGWSQDSYWQQQVEYEMDIEMDTKNYQFTGRQAIRYTNHSPDTLHRAFYHLYFNAFQPSSMMDLRSRSLPDPDPRVRDRISKLKEEDYGYHRVLSLKQDGENLNYVVEGTILEVNLNHPIEPGSTSVLELEFESQVPLQIRRSGKTNREGIDLSMTQWYPKLCEYDEDGWHPNPYVGREFYGIWGDFDVRINIDAEYILGGTGVLQNPDEIGYGYSDVRKKPKGKRATWHFKAENVHDFAWAADPDYVHFSKQVVRGPLLHFFYDKKVQNPENWQILASKLDSVWPFIESNFGVYPYPQYSILQGGDGGMEYPMATLITGNRPLGSLIGVSVHELMHSWYQGVLGTNESHYPWMDEGFTSYASSLIMKQINDPESNRDPFAGNYVGYRAFKQSGMEEPLCTHADHYDSNRAYGVGAYVKGSIYLHQLGYIIGDDKLNQTMLRYFNTWKFKHPNALDFIRIAEMESDMILDWYHEYWIHTTKEIDYAVDTVYGIDEGTIVVLKKLGRMPMPLDVEVNFKDDPSVMYNIPLRMMRGNKTKAKGYETYEVIDDWLWTHQSYTLELIGVQPNEIQFIKIDPKNRMADMFPENNVWPRKKQESEKE